MDENGEVAYASINNEPGEVTINYNLFDSYHEQKIMNKKDYEKVKSDYAERSSGCITLERENESDYFSYRALKGTQYMIACEVDSTIVQNVLADYQIMMLHIWLTVTCIIIAMLAALGISILWIYNEKNKVAYARRNACSRQKQQRSWKKSILHWKRRCCLQIRQKQRQSVPMKRKVYFYPI